MRGNAERYGRPLDELKLWFNKSACAGVIAVCNAHRRNFRGVGGRRPWQRRFPFGDILVSSGDNRDSHEIAEISMFWGRQIFGPSDFYRIL